MTVEAVSRSEYAQSPDDFTWVPLSRRERSDARTALKAQAKGSSLKASIDRMKPSNGNAFRKRVLDYHAQSRAAVNAFEVSNIVTRDESGAIANVDMYEFDSSEPAKSHVRQYLYGRELEERFGEQARLDLSLALEHELHEAAARKYDALEPQAQASVVAEAYSSSWDRYQFWNEHTLPMRAQIPGQVAVNNS